MIQWSSKLERKPIAVPVSTLKAGLILLVHWMHTKVFHFGPIGPLFSSYGLVYFLTKLVEGRAFYS